jgi:uncharacterized protein involved in exopolysaccharide biosynthesis
MEASSDMNLKRILRLVYRKKGLFVLISAVVTSLIVIGGYLLPKTYEAKSVIFIERNVLNELIKNVTVTSSFEEKIKALSVVIKSRSLILKAMSDLDLEVGRSADQIEAAIRRFQEQVQIEIEVNKATRRETDLFIVSYTDSNPRLASDFVNTLVRRYIEENLSIKREQAYGASQFLLDQIATFKIKLDKLEMSIARQRKDTTAAGKPVSLYDRLEPLIRKREELLLQYTESHPEVLKIQAEIELVKQQMGSGAAAPGPNMALMDLERERDTTKKIYEDLLATLGKSEVSAQIEVQDKAGAFRILDPAIEPTRPISPNMIQIILLALLGGLATGAGILLLIDMSDSSVKSVETIKRIGLPILAIISTMQTDREAAAARRRDRRLYVAAGLYFAALLTIAGMELMGITAVDKFVQGTRVEIGKTVKNIMEPGEAKHEATREGS